MDELEKIVLERKKFALTKAVESTAVGDAADYVVQRAKAFDDFLAAENQAKR